MPPLPPDDIGTSCEEKAIINTIDYSLTYDKYNDYDKVYHDIASCYSLHTKENNLCCYIKNHFKSEEADKKFTQRGCIQVSLDTLNSGGIGNFIKDLENKIEDKDHNITKVDIDIDCNSRFIKLTGLLLLAFLL